MSIIVATSREKTDDKLLDFCKKKKIKIFRGSLNDIHKRTTDCIKYNNLDASELLYKSMELLKKNKKSIRSFIRKYAQFLQTKMKPKWELTSIQNQKKGGKMACRNRC